MQNEEIIKRLAEPFKASEIEWRIQGVDQSRMRGMAVPYIDSRAIQRRLDDVLSPFGWKNEFKQWHENSQLCCISILHTDENGNKEWHKKWDGAENSKIEAVKGGLSDSFKRVAVLWGIGRYLYDFGAKWVDVEKKGDSFIIKQNEYTSLDAFHDAEVQRLANGQGCTRGKESSVGSPAPGNGSNKNSHLQHNASSNKAPANQPAQASTGNISNPKSNDLYMVKRRLVSTNANGQSTQLEMVSLEDGTVVRAFLRGSNDSIAEGVKLKNIKITEKKGTHRNYNVCVTFTQRLSSAAEIIKKQYLLQILKIMLSVENELTDMDRNEFRSHFQELASKVNSITRALKEGSRLNCDDLVLDINEKFILYLKGSIKNIVIYRKSRQIQIVT